jgi:hypothetical protein
MYNPQANVAERINVSVGYLSLFNDASILAWPIVSVATVISKKSTDTKGPDNYDFWRHYPELWNLTKLILGPLVTMERHLS